MSKKSKKLKIKKVNHKISAMLLCLKNNLYDFDNKSVKNKKCQNVLHDLNNNQIKNK